MQNWHKLVIGLLATATLAYANHLAAGEAYIQKLEAHGNMALKESGLDLQINLPRDPLSRYGGSVWPLHIPEDEERIAAAKKSLSKVAGVGYISFLRYGKANSGSNISLVGNISQKTSQEARQKENAPTNSEDSSSNPCAPSAIAKTRSIHINFESGSAYISPDGGKKIAQIAKAVEGCPAAKLKIFGHSDRFGRQAVNEEIATERAIRVRDALLKMGLEESRLTAKGVGASEPLVSGKDSVTAAQNRRVEFRLGPG